MLKPANKLFLLLCFVLALGCGESTSGSATAQAAPSASAPAALSAPPSVNDVAPVAYVEGTHYERLPQAVPTVDRNKIEVTEVFWYGCSHCYDFEPLIAAWSASLPDDVVLVKNPAMWDNQGIMETHARIYYAAKVLDVEEKVSSAAFRALNIDRQPLRSESDIAKLFTDNGVSQADFERTFNSFGVTSAVRQAESRQRAYRVQGTPELVVNGTYRISARMAGSQSAMLKVADYLVTKIRNEKMDS